MQLPSSLQTKLPSLNMPSGLSIGRKRSGADVVGLDIQPGFIAAVRGRVNGSIVAEQAAHLPAGAYLVHAGPGGPLLGFDQLRVAMSQAVERAMAGPARRAGAPR